MLGVYADVYVMGFPFTSHTTGPVNQQATINLPKSDFTAKFWAGGAMQMNWSREN